MNLMEYSKYDGIGLAQLVRRKEVTPLELANLAIEGAKQVNGELNAILEIFQDRINSKNAGVFNDSEVFQGVPFLLKDCGSCEAGRKQEMGSHIFHDSVATKSGYLIEKFLKAGMVSIGRSAVPEFCMSYSTESPVHGRTCNPWNVNYTAGGSSGGSCASVAAGIVPIAHGNDSAGSIRMPASCCNLVGLKPTRGRTSTGPNARDYPSGLNSEFAVTRTIRDCAALLDIAEGPGADEVRTVVLPKKSFLHSISEPPKRLKIALCRTSMIDSPLNEEVCEVVNKVAQTLEGLGHNIEEDYYNFDYQEFQRHDCNFHSASMASELSRFKQDGYKVDIEKLDSINRWLFERGQEVTGSEAVSALSAYNDLRHHIYNFFSEYDLILTPTMTRLPAELPVDNTFFNWAVDGQYLVPANVAGIPAISLPVGMSLSGLPIGVQFVGRYGDEMTLLQIGRLLEDIMPWKEMCPPVHVSRCS